MSTTPNEIRIPETIDKNFFDDENHNFFMEGLFYKLDHQGLLSLGGYEWKQYKKKSFDDDKVAAAVLESKLLECFSHSKVLKDYFVLMDGDIKSLTIHFDGFWFHADDAAWKSFWNTLLLGGNHQHVKKLCLASCHLSKEGLQTLSWLLNFQQSGFQIQHCSFEDVRLPPGGCKQWITHGLSQLQQPLIMKTACLWSAPSCFLPLFLRYCRLEKLEYKSDFYVDNVDDQGGNEHVEFDMEMDYNSNIIQDENMDRNHDDYSPNIPFMTIHHYNNRDRNGNQIQMFGNMEQHSYLPRVESLTLILYAVVEPQHYSWDTNLMESCREIIIQLEGDNVFPCDGLDSLIHEKGNLKSLYLLTSYFDGYYTMRFSSLERFLSNVDLTWLDTFQVDCLSQDEDVFFALCHGQLEQNRGPKCLKISFEHEWWCNTQRRDVLALETLAKSLHGNDKIERLEIQMIELDVTSLVLLQFIQRICVGEYMPRLVSFELHALEEGDGGGPPSDDNEYASNIASMMMKEQEETMILLQQIGKNKRIQHLRLPFDDNGLSLVLDEMPKYKNLLRYCGNEISDGIWSHALGRKSTPSLMFHVVQQIPGLFQYCCDRQQDEKKDLPMFSVPHHPNCPACQQEQKDRRCLPVSGTVG